MKPGSLVVHLGTFPNVLGIILRESNKYNYNNYPWERVWEMWCNNKIIVEVESCLKLI